MLQLEVYFDDDGKPRAETASASVGEPNGSPVPRRSSTDRQLHGAMPAPFITTPH
jgi:hypothetical protein